MQILIPGNGFVPVFAAMQLLVFPGKGEGASFGLRGEVQKYEICDIILTSGCYSPSAELCRNLYLLDFLATAR